MGRAVVLVLAVLAGVVAIFSIWANDELLDTGSWTSVSGRLLESRSVRHRVAAFLGEELTAQTETQLRAAGQDEIAETVVPRLRRAQTELAEKVMTTPRFQRIWERANRSGQRELVRVLDEEDGAGHGAVVVDLTPALRQLADELEDEGFAREFGIGGLGSRVEPGAARIKILEAQELGQAQDVVRVVRHLTLPAVLALILFYGLALFLGRRHLRGTLLGVGIALLATGGLALLARSLAGHRIVDGLLTEDADRKAAEAAWRIASSKIADLAGIAIGLGAAVLLLLAAVAVFRKATEGLTAAA